MDWTRGLPLIVKSEDYESAVPWTLTVELSHPPGRKHESMPVLDLEASGRLGVGGSGDATFKPEKTPSAQIVFLQPSTFVVAGTTIKDPDEVLLHMVDGGVVEAQSIPTGPAMPVDLFVGVVDARPTRIEVRWANRTRYMGVDLDLTFDE